MSGVVGKILGSDKPKRDPAAEKRLADQEKRLAAEEKAQQEREVDLKRQERARRQAVAAAQRGSRLLLYDEGGQRSIKTRAA